MMINEDRILSVKLWLEKEMVHIVEVYVSLVGLDN